jgi:hypothetical protein
MEELGRHREEWFRQFLELPHGIPDEDTFRRLFERVNPAELMEMPAKLAWRDERSGMAAGGDRRKDHPGEREGRGTWGGTHGQRMGE